MADPLAREQLKLYGLPQAEFTAARNARAKELRKDDPELAATVAALPKPTAAAAALNELVREDPSEARALIQSGKRLREAQEAAVAGKRGADLTKAIDEHRAALDRMQRDLRRRKLSGATVDKAAKDTPRRVGRPGPAAAARTRHAVRRPDRFRVRSRPGDRPDGTKARVGRAEGARPGRPGQAKGEGARTPAGSPGRPDRGETRRQEGGGREARGGAARRDRAARGRARDEGDGARSGVCSRLLMKHDSGHHERDAGRDPPLDAEP